MVKGQKIFRVVGIGLLVVGLVGLGMTFYPVAKLELGYRTIKATKTDIVPLDANLGIVIPKIGANSRVIKDVDPLNSKVYQQALTLGVAHAKGTPLPGEPGNAFLFSHSSVDFTQAAKYNSVFYLLSKLTIGDQIYIYNQGKRINFYVTEKKIVGAEAIQYLSSTDNEPSVTLMTCWPPGTDLKRLLVVAKTKQE